MWWVDHLRSMYCDDFMSGIGEIEEVEIDWSKDNDNIQQQMWKIHGRGSCDKASCKGVQKAKNKDIINIDTFNKCWENGQIFQATNINMKVDHHEMWNYEMLKNGVTHHYTKRRVANNLNNTFPLSI